MDWWLSLLVISWPIVGAITMWLTIKDDYIITLLDVIIIVGGIIFGWVTFIIWVIDNADDVTIYCRRK